MTLPAELVHIDPGVHHWAVSGLYHASVSVHLNLEAVSLPFGPAGVQAGNFAFRVLQNGETVVLGTVQLPDIAAGMAEHFHHITQDVSGEIDHVDADIHERTPAHNLFVVLPVRFELS